MTLPASCTVPGMAIDLGDAATWTGVLLSVGFSSAALVVSIHSLRHARRSADAAERQAIAAEKALPPPPPAVAWQIVHVGRSRFAMYNTGTEPATGVEIDTERATNVVLEHDGKARVSPGAALTFLIAVTMGNPAPQELWVTWDGQPEPVAVPVPPWRL